MLVKLFSKANIVLIAILFVTSIDAMVFLEKLRFSNAVFELTFKAVNEFDEQFKVVSAAKSWIPVKSAMLRFFTSKFVTVSIK